MDGESLVCEEYSVTIHGCSIANKDTGASYGYYASRQLQYFGYKLVVASTLAGVPLVYALVPVHTDKREAAEASLYSGVTSLPLRAVLVVTGKQSFH